MALSSQETNHIGSVTSVTVEAETKTTLMAENRLDGHHGSKSPSTSSSEND